MDPTEVFVRGVWKCVPDEEDSSWVRRIADAGGSHGPLGDYGPILTEMLEKGISAETIARFAKIVGYETAFSICYHLGDPNASYEGFPPEGDRIEWGLFRVDPGSGEPLDPIDGGHEWLLSMDPSDREMCPKKPDR